MADDLSDDPEVWSVVTGQPSFFDILVPTTTTPHNGATLKPVPPREEGNDMAGIDWGDPPHSPTSTKWWRRDIIAELKKNPGEWARVETRVPTSRVQGWKNQGCEATTRTVAHDADGNRLADVYARWPEQ